MLDANTELNSLRHKLHMKNLSNSIVDEIVDEASKEISMATSDILADAMSEAVNAGSSAMSTDFIDELRITRSGASFDIITASGKTDFSEPPFPMLPRLLQSAKVAKDGSLYKVIPIKNKSGKLQKRVAVTTEAALQDINEARYKAKEERDLDKESNRTLSPDAMKGGDVMSSMLSLSNSRRKAPEKRERSNEPVIDFKTASSKQDPNTQWVHPGRAANMGSQLREINMGMQDNIDNVIRDIIRKYEDEY
jgi:hypothetical protein